MGKSLDSFYKKQSLIYKYFLYFISVGLIVFFFPREGKFKYEFQKGRTWQYENLYAPFDFSINKTEEELIEERNYLSDYKSTYFAYNDSIYSEVLKKYDQSYENTFSNLGLSISSQSYYFNVGKYLTF